MGTGPTSASPTGKAKVDKNRWPMVESVHVGYLSLKQAAHYLGGVSKDTVRRWIELHDLPHYFIPHGSRGKLLFKKGELDQWTRRFKSGWVEKKRAEALDESASLG